MFLKGFSLARDLNGLTVRYFRYACVCVCVCVSWHYFWYVVSVAPATTTPLPAAHGSPVQKLVVLQTKLNETRRDETKQKRHEAGPFERSLWRLWRLKSTTDERVYVSFFQCICMCLSVYVCMRVCE